MIPLEWLAWPLAGASLIATVANIKKYAWCFPIWAFTNASWTIYNFHLGPEGYAQGTLFFAYTCLAFWGIYEWRIKQ